MATAKLSSFVSKSTKSADTISKEDQMAKSTTTQPKYKVFTLSGENKKGEAWGSHFLATAEPLTEAECKAMLGVFDVAVAGKARKAFDRVFFRGMTKVMTDAGMAGGAMYWLADDGMTGLDVVKKMVADVLGDTKPTKPAAQQARHASEQPKAASKGSKGKKGQAEAAKARNAKREAYTVVLG